MATALEICTLLATFPRVTNPIPVQFSITRKTVEGTQILDGCMYTDSLSGDLTLYIPCDVYNIFLKHRNERYIETFPAKEGRIWYLAAYMQGEPISHKVPDEFSVYHPFGENVILKNISPQTARAIELTPRERQIAIVELKEDL